MKKLREFETYRELRKALLSLSEAELDQPVQIVANDNNEIVTCMPGIALGTVAEMQFDGCRSVTDNRYHADDVIILADGNPHAPDGAVAYELRPEDKRLSRNQPIYEGGKPTPREVQLAPAKQEARP